MRDRSCDFEAANGEHIHVYGGKGDDITRKIEFNQATIPANSGKYGKLDGVGDEAYWRKDNDEVVRRKGDLWRSANGGTPAKSETDARKLGELCNKVYSSAQ